MALIGYNREYTFQPRSGLILDYNNPLLRGVTEVWCGAEPKRTLVQRKLTSLYDTGSNYYGNGYLGRSLSLNSNTLYGMSLGSNHDVLFKSNTTATVAIYRKSKDTTLRGSVLFGYGSGTSRISCHAPWSDGNIYWDAGGYDAARRLTVTSQTKTTNPETMVFIAGPVTGREVWRNKTRVGSNTGITGTFPTLAGQPVYLGGIPGMAANDLEDIYLAIITNTEWSSTQVNSFAENPWQIFKSYGPDLATYIKIINYGYNYPASDISNSNWTRVPTI